MKILENTRYLAHQGIALRGDGNECDSNFIQLLQLRCVERDVQTWLRKKFNKYTSHDIQNELLKLMAIQILGDVQKRVQAAGKYSILADECTDCSNKEQFTINLRYVDGKLEDHTEFIGLYAQDSINADSLVASIKDVLCRMNLKLSDCRGQCYDGASNMSGSKNGVAAQLITEESRAIYTHCYCHALNLAISDALKNCKVCRDALDIAFEITKLVKFSSTRNVLFDKIQSEANEDDESLVGIRTFCPTRWTVKGDSVESILVNYDSLMQLWNTCLETGSKLQSDVKCRILGVQSQMSNFSLLFGLKLCERILKITDNLSKTLQKRSLSAAEGQHVTKLTVKTLTKMRTSEAFDLFYKLIMNLQVQTGINPPVLPRKRRTPAHLEVGDGEAYHSQTIQEHYLRYYYEALDYATTAITSRFDQPGYIMYCNLEGLLTKAANQQDFSDELQKITDFYKDDLNPSSLSVQLTNLGSHFDHGSTITLQDCLQYLRQLSDDARCFYSEVCQVAKLLLIMPATNACSERSFSVMRRLKTYLRSTMGQARLNHLMILHIYKEKLDDLDLISVANQFVSGSKHRFDFFGKF